MALSFGAFIKGYLSSGRGPASWSRIVNRGENIEALTLILHSRALPVKEREEQNPG